MEELDMEVVVATRNSDEILAHIKQTKEVGIYFLDIDLKTGMNGLELAKEIRRYDPRGFIVFVTTHSEMSYMTFRYRLEAMDYILKNEDDETVHNRIYHCLMDANERFSSGNNRIQDIFTFKVNGHLFTVKYNEILFFETSSNIHKVILHGKRRETEFYGKIKDLEEELDERFCRCHRSFLVNKKNIKEVDLKRKMIIMVNGETCPISVRLLKNLKELQL